MKITDVLQWDTFRKVGPTMEVTRELLPLLMVVGIIDETHLAAVYPTYSRLHYHPSWFLDARWVPPYRGERYTYLYQIAGNFDLDMWRQSRLIDRRELLIQVYDEGNIDLAASKQVAKKTIPCWWGDVEGEILPPIRDCPVITWYDNQIIEWESLL